MGEKITVDSATMMNKGLELIERCSSVPFPDADQILVHMRHVHSAVGGFADKSVIAQLGVPNDDNDILRSRGRNACLRSKAALPSDVGELTLSARYEPLPVAAAIEAARRGGLAPCAVNAANEEAVSLFREALSALTTSESCRRRAVASAEKRRF
jgi:1-deoxy-D-xylulose-5-phosphate reductoisomerase